MTLTEYETAVLALPGYQRFVGAGPAFALRQALAEGQVFATARDRITAEPWHHRALVRAEELAVFGSLSGP